MKLVSISLIKGTIFYLAKKDNILTHPKMDINLVIIPSMKKLNQTHNLKHAKTVLDATEN